MDNRDQQSENMEPSDNSDDQEQDKSYKHVQSETNILKNKTSSKVLPSMNQLQSN